MVVLNKLKHSKIILGFQMVSGWSFVDSLNNATKINRVANKLRLAHGVLIYAEIKIDIYQGMYKNRVKNDRILLEIFCSFILRTRKSKAGKLKIT